MLGEDDPIRAAPPTIGQLYDRVRGFIINHIFIICILMLLNGVIQGMVIVPYIALAPTIAGAITLGFVQQITRAFGRVEDASIPRQSWLQ